jgi:hypothetical protein
MDIIRYCDKFKDTIEYKQWQHMKNICKKKKKKYLPIIHLYKILKEKYGDLVLDDKNEIVDDLFEPYQEIRLSDGEENTCNNDNAETFTNFILEDFQKYPEKQIKLRQSSSVRDLIQYFNELGSK